MTGENVCAYCGTDLTKVNEIHVVEGMNFCRKDCAIAHQAEVITASAYDTATEWYNEGSEIVTPMDIGLVYEKKWTAYDRETDVTTIFLSRYLDKECNEVVSTEVLGFYWGEPTEKDTEAYTGSLKAYY